MTSPSRPRRRCPQCGAAIPDDAPDAVLPFCSVRCQQRDLMAWLDEDYVIGEPIPGITPPEPDPDVEH